MNPPTREVVRFDSLIFRENLRKQPDELFLKYAGQYVAWSLDGTALLVTADTPDQLNDKLEARGIPYEEVVNNYIDPPDVSYA